MESSRKCWQDGVRLVLEVSPRAGLSAARSPNRAHPEPSAVPSSADDLPPAPPSTCHKPRGRQWNSSIFYSGVSDSYSYVSPSCAQ